MYTLDKMWDRQHLKSKGETKQLELDSNLHSDTCDPGQDPTPHSLSFFIYKKRPTLSC